MKRALFLSVLWPLLLAAACNRPAVQKCVIELGESGQTERYEAALMPDEQRTWLAVPASSFVRSTSGPCFFEVFNGDNLDGRSVMLGSELTGRIRAGLDGVTNRDSGGGETWRIRSLTMQRASTSCRLQIGGNGIRMDYYTGDYAQVPAIDRVSWFQGGDCGAKVWNHDSFGDPDPHNRFKSLHPSGPNASTYDPGFRMRSLQISDQSATCPAFTNDQGRCLPQIQLSRDIYDAGVASEDRDRDGLVDELENELAEAFRPIYVNHSTEDATRVDIYTAATGELVTEPAIVFQVHPVREGEIVIRFMRLWLWDKYDSTICGTHKGDTQRHQIYLKTAPPGDTTRSGKLWYVYKSEGGIEHELDWEMGQGSIRGVSFERLPGDTSSNPANHLVIYFTKGKHHEYADQGWSGQNDKLCFQITAHIDGRGNLHVPPLPKRAATVRSPRGAGDRFDYTNVGSRDVPFFNDLEPYGFPGESFWNSGDFYEAEPADRGFE